MPPRYAYWTIIVDGQPTAFRSGALEDIMPTFNRLKEKQPSAELKWFQNGQLWSSRHDAQEFMRARGDRGREKDPRQAKDRDPGSGVRNSESGQPERAWNAKPEWKTRSSFKPSFAPRSSGASTFAKAPADSSEGKPAWKPKGTFEPKEAGHRSASGDKPAWKPKGASARTSFGDREDKPAWKGQAKSDRKPEWKPKGTFKPKEAGHASGWGEKPAWKGKPSGTAREQARSSFRPKSYTPKDEGASPTRSSKAREQKLDWSPKAESRPGGPNAGFAPRDPDAPKRKWVPKAEYKKSLGIEAKRDDKWRPGGEHVDPKQKYKDAKKAKWTRVKATIRARSSKPRKPKDE